MNILYATDENYVVIMATSLCSLLENNKESNEIKIYVLEDSLKEESKRRLEKLVHKYDREIKFLNIAELIKYYEKIGIPKYNGSYSTYIRLYAGEILKDLARCLYIDCDTIILERLDEMYNMELNNHPAAAIIDCNHNDANKALNKDMKSKYFNTGVLLINLNYWREKKLFNEFIQVVKKIDLKRTLTNSDQELINYLLGDEIITIDLKYNVGSYFRVKENERLMWILQKNKDNFYTKKEIRDAAQNPAIIHFTGGSWGRPWFSNSKDPKKEIWDKYLLLTPWHDYEKQSCKISVWRQCCLLAEKLFPIWLFAILKRYEAKYMIWRKCFR